VEYILVSLPRSVADELTKNGIGAKATPSRSSVEVVQVALSVVGLAADTVSLVLARDSLRAASRRMIETLLRNPKARKLNLSVSDAVTIEVDLNELQSPRSKEKLRPAFQAALDLALSIVEDN
jgi:hypothetical protein